MRPPFITGLLRRLWRPLACTAIISATLAVTAPVALANSTLPFNGGQVQNQPVVYLDFWGPEWSGSYAHEASLVRTMFSKYLGVGSSYAKIITQYGDGTEDPHGTTLGGSWVDPTGPPSDISMSDIANEAVNAQTQEGWSVTPDSQFFVLPQPGTTYSFGGMCGYHTWSTNSTTQSSFPLVQIMFPGDPAYPDCAGATESYLTAVAAHEWAEAATDPEVGQGWGTVNFAKSTVTEVADMCETLPTAQFGNSGIWVPPLYDAQSGNCTFNGSSVTPAVSSTPTSTTTPSSTPTTPPTQVPVPNPNPNTNTLTNTNVSPGINPVGALVIPALIVFLAALAISSTAHRRNRIQMAYAHATAWQQAQPVWNGTAWVASPHAPLALSPYGVPHPYSTPAVAPNPWAPNPAQHPAAPAQMGHPMAPAPAPAAPFAFTPQAATPAAAPFAFTPHTPAPAPGPVMGVAPHPAAPQMAGSNPQLVYPGVAHYSPDGRWMWNGAQWVPTQAPTPAPAPPPVAIHYSPDGQWMWNGSTWVPARRQ